MSRLRVEDVKEAHRIVMKSLDNEWTLDDEVQYGSVKVLAEAALAWLNPDYEAAFPVVSSLPSLDVLSDEALKDLLRFIVDAALVGFHPGDKGDESGPRQTPSALLRQLGVDDPLVSPEVPTPKGDD